nr:prepilin-type N-terminal cleavage/methylation domain-containing protein [uncultured Niameybacter sp.]
MMKKKLNNKKGFTLAELLIVVAIIGILVAISIPIFTSKLGDAKEATDQANERAAKAAAATEVLGGDATSKTYYYNAESGKLVESSTKPAEITGYGKSTDNNGKVVKVEVGSDDSITVSWE